MKKLVPLGLLAIVLSLPGAPAPHLLGTGGREAQADEPYVPVVATARADKQDVAAEFRFPDDRGGRLLAQLLDQGKETLAPPKQLGPRRVVATLSLEGSGLPPANLTRAPQPLPGEGARVLRPHSLPDELPLTGTPTTRLLPEAPRLPAAAPFRTPSPDPNQPIPLPVLARPVPDRATLEDPTAETSLIAATTAVPPTRTTPAPYTRAVVPNPYENREAVRLRSSSVEEGSPLAGSVKTPRDGK